LAEASAPRLPRQGDRRLRGREATKIVQRVQETAKGIGKTLTEGATEVEQRAKAAGAQSRPVVEKLEKSAHGFGESIWDGMKSVGRSVQTFFTRG
jgi:hypothetical protein